MNTQNEYNVWHRKVHGSETGEKLILNQWHEDALALSPDLSGKKVLEVGCGAGDFSLYLEGMGGVCVGLDFSSAAIEIAIVKKNNRNSKIQFLVGDAQALPFPDESFDIVFSCECIEHVPNPKRAVMEMSRVLKPGGSLVLTTENYTNAIILSWMHCWLMKRPFNSGESIQPIEHFFIFPMIKRMMRCANLKVMKTSAAHYVFLIFPKIPPYGIVVRQFKGKFLRRIFKFFGRHWTFLAIKPIKGR